MTSSCPAPEDFSRQISLGDPGPLALHLSACAICGPEWESLRTNRALAAELPGVSPEAGAEVGVRGRVLRLSQAEQREARVRRTLGWALVAIAAAALLAIGLRSRGGGEAQALYHATLTPSPGARFVRESARPTEVVRLESGTLHVLVEPLHTGERFFIRAFDSEVEVRGTAFDVSVEGGHLSAVHVDHGRVEVRDGTALPILLGPGGEWRRTEERASAAPGAEDEAPSPSPSAVPGPAPSSHGRAERAGLPPGPSVVPAPVVLPDAPQEIASSLPPAPPRVPSAPPPPPPRGEAPAVAVPAAPREGNPGREDERRERLEERRERGDQRRLR